MNNTDLAALSNRISNLLSDMEKVSNEALAFSNAKNDLNETSKALSKLIGEINTNLGTLDSIVKEIQKVAVEDTLSKFSSCANACQDEVLKAETKIELAVQGFNNKINSIADELADKTEQKNQVFLSSVSSNINELSKKIEGVPSNVERINQKMNTNIQNIVNDEMKKAADNILLKVSENSEDILSKINVAILASCVAIALSAYSIFK